MKLPYDKTKLCNGADITWNNMVKSYPKREPKMLSYDHAGEWARNNHSKAYRRQGIRGKWHYVNSTWTMYITSLIAVEEGAYRQKIYKTACGSFVYESIAEFSTTKTGEIRKDSDAPPPDMCPRCWLMMRTQKRQLEKESSIKWGKGLRAYHARCKKEREEEENGGR